MNSKLDSNRSQRKCIVCCKPLRDEKELFFGSYAVSNRFSKRKQLNSSKYDISLNQCDVCGLVQLTEFPPVDAIRPKNSWIKYNEPSKHLSAVVEYLSTIIPADSTCLGISPFDVPLIEGMADLGFKGSQLELFSNLNYEDDSYPYLESYESALELALQNFSSTQPHEVVFYRYLLEHARNPVVILNNLVNLLKPNGYIVVEVPDSKKFIMSHDYSFIWEEHISYFTEDSLNRCIRHAGLQVEKVFRFPGLLEDALVFILKIPCEKISKKLPLTDFKELDLYDSYVNNYQNIRQLHFEKIKKIKSEGGNIILFGAGHQAIMFINLMGIKDYIECVIDDDYNKAGTYLADSMIPVIASKDFFGLRDFDVCIMGVPPPTDIKIVNKLSEFLANGRLIYSIFNDGTSIPSLLTS